MTIFRHSGRVAPGGELVHGGISVLVLTRKKDEEIRIGDDIVVKVVEIKGNMVRLGFVAPDDVAIYRKELYDEIVLSNEMAAGVTVDELHQKDIETSGLDD